MGANFLLHYRILWQLNNKMVNGRINRGLTRRAILSVLYYLFKKCNFAVTFKMLYIVMNIIMNNYCHLILNS